MNARAAAPPVIIEAALNGVTSKERNPLVPITPEEHAKDALACVAAGATVIHTHTADMLAPVEDVAAQYAAAYRPVVERASRRHLLRDHRGRPDDRGPIPARRAPRRHGPDARRVRRHRLRQPRRHRRATDSPPVAATSTRTTSPTSRTRWTSVATADWARASRCSNRASCASCSRTRRPARCPTGTLVKFYFSEGGYLGGGDPLWGMPPIPRGARRVSRDARRRADPVGGRGARRFAARRAGRPLALERGGHLRVGLEDCDKDPRTSSRSPARPSSPRRWAAPSRRSTRRRPSSGCHDGEATTRPSSGVSSTRFAPATSPARPRASTPSATTRTRGRATSPSRGRR